MLHDSITRPGLAVFSQRCFMAVSVGTSPFSYKWSN